MSELPKDQREDIEKHWARIRASTKRDAEKFWCMVGYCGILGAIIMGAIAIFRMNHDASPLGFALGAIAVAGLLFLLMAD